MKEAVTKMKAELGDDAVILHTKKYKEGGILGYGSKEIVEITAAIEDEKPVVKKEVDKPQRPIMPQSVLSQYKTSGTAEGVALAERELDSTARFLPEPPSSEDNVIDENNSSVRSDGIQDGRNQAASLTEAMKSNNRNPDINSNKMPYENSGKMPYEEDSLPYEVDISSRDNNADDSNVPTNDSYNNVSEKATQTSSVESYNTNVDIESNINQFDSTSNSSEYGNDANINANENLTTPQVEDSAPVENTNEPEQNSNYNVNQQNVEPTATINPLNDTIQQAPATPLVSQPPQPVTSTSAVQEEIPQVVNQNLQQAAPSQNIQQNVNPQPVVSQQQNQAQSPVPSVQPVQQIQPQAQPIPNNQPVQDVQSTAQVVQMTDPATSMQGSLNQNQYPQSQMQNQFEQPVNAPQNPQQIDLTQPLTPTQLAQAQAMMIAQFNQLQMAQAMQQAMAQAQAQSMSQQVYMQSQQQSPPSSQPQQSSQTQSQSKVEINESERESQVKIKKLENEIAQMKALLAKVIGKDGDRGAISLHEALRRQEVNEEILSNMAANAGAGETLSDSQSREAKSTLVKFLTENINFSEGIRLNRHGVRIAALLGTTGVGKTTTLAKIAAKFVLEQGISAALITADTYRISAVEQLRTYSDILGLPLEIVYSPNELAKAINKHRNRDLILIDTAGRSQHNDYQMKELQEFLRANQRIEKHIVLSTTTKASDAKDILDKFSVCEPEKIIFTKTDETASVGLVLNLLFKQKLSLSYMTNGQSVPDDITPASAEALADLLLKRNF